MTRGWQMAAVALVALMFFVGGAAKAQPLADRVPDEAMLYVGWAGSSQLGDRYGNSHLKALLDDSGLPELVDRAIAQAIAKGLEDAQLVMLGLTHDIAGLALKHPTALYLTPPAEGGQPPSAMIICEAGADTEALIEKLQPIVSRAADEGAPVSMTIRDRLIQVSVFNPPRPTTERRDALAAADTAAQSFKRTGVITPTAALYADVTKLLSIADMVTAMRGEQEQWTKMRAALGLDGLKSLAWAGGFTDRDWVSGLYVEAPSPRKGIAALLDADEPLSEAAMKLVPRTAAMAGGGKLDLAALHDAIMTGLRQADPQAADEAEAAGERLTEQLGFDVRNDLLAGLGDEWLWYTDARVAGTGPMGTVVVNRLRKPGPARDALTKALSMANQFIAAETAGEDLTIQLRRRTVDGVEMHYLAVPLISPTIGFHEDRLYLGLFPASVSGAVAREAADGSILDNKAFALRREQLGAQRLAGFEFFDVDQVIERGYPTLMMAGRTVAGLTDLARADAPARVMPQLATLHEHAGAAGSFAWADDEGYYARSRSFMPGAALLATIATSDMAFSQSALLGGILLPALDRSRVLAERTHSAAKMRGIAQAVIMYSVEHDDKMPDDLGVLVADGFIDSADMFLHPDSPLNPPAHADKQKLAKWVVNNTDYVYVGNERESNRISWARVLLYERPNADWAQESINIAFEDGRVKAYPRAEALRIIEAGRVK